MELILVGLLSTVLGFGVVILALVKDNAKLRRERDAQADTIRDLQQTVGGAERDWRHDVL